MLGTMERIDGQVKIPDLLRAAPQVRPVLDRYGLKVAADLWGRRNRWRFSLRLTKSPCRVCWKSRGAGVELAHLRRAHRTGSHLEVSPRRLRLAARLTGLVDLAARASTYPDSLAGLRQRGGAHSFFARLLRRHPSRHHGRFR